MTARQFILGEKINEGATTTVYKAHQSVLGRQVLLKILHKHLIGDTTLTERFRREARACALIRSDYIVQVYDLTEIDGAPAIVMEYVEGTSLKEVLASSGAMSVPRARQIVIETLNALRAAHSSGVIHRDIKPGNILLTDAGHVKVTDFGLAAISVAQTVTMDGAVLGTPAYLPPEHIRGEAADERSDLFSLGVTFIELLTGHRIFEGSSYSACINKILHFDIGSVDTLIADRECADVIKKMVHPDRAQRFVSADAALAALQGESKHGVLQTLPPLPESPSAPQQSDLQPASISRMPPRTNNRFVRLGVTLALLGFAALIPALVWFMTGSGNGQSVPESAMIQPAARDSARPASSGLPGPRSAAQPEPATIDRAPAAGLHPRAEDQAMRSEEKDSSGLVLTCTPWGKIFLDNQYLGETPLNGVVTVRPGTHTVNFTNPEFLPIVKTISVSPGEQRSVGANFFESAGYLVVTVVPWAEVYIDDQYRDTTPREKPIIVTAGKRKIRLHNPGFSDIVSDVVIPLNDTLRVSYSLTKLR